MDLVQTIFTDFFLHTQPFFGAIGLLLLLVALFFSATLVRSIFHEALREKQRFARNYIIMSILLFGVTLLYIIIDTHVISLPDPVIFYGFYLLGFTILFGIRVSLFTSILIIIFIEYYVYEPHTISLFRRPSSLAYMAFTIITALFLGQLIRQYHQKLLKKTEDLNLLIKARDQFSAIAVHELKTPLTTISLYSQVLDKQYKNKKASKILQDSVQTISHETNKLTYMINDLLDFSRFQNNKFALRPKVFNLDRLCKERVKVVQSMYPDHKYTFQQKVHNTAIYADRIALDRVLTNLLTNAGKYSQPGGKIVTKLQRQHKEFILSVKDEGAGIRSEHLERLFEPFYQVEGGKKGLGLGLHIAKSIIELHQGRMWVESRAGRGSTFFVSLPIKRAKNKP